jgi:hypothetical protein
MAALLVHHDLGNTILQSLTCGFGKGKLLFDIRVVSSIVKIATSKKVDARPIELKRVTQRFLVAGFVALVFQRDHVSVFGLRQDILEEGRPVEKLDHEPHNVTRFHIEVVKELIVQNGNSFSVVLEVFSSC